MCVCIWSACVWQNIKGISRTNFPSKWKCNSWKYFAQQSQNIWFEWLGGSVGMILLFIHDIRMVVTQRAEIIFNKKAECHIVCVVCMKDSMGKQRTHPTQIAWWLKIIIINGLVLVTNSSTALHTSDGKQKKMFEEEKGKHKSKRN